MLKYFGYQTACDIAFGVFIITWILARHVFYLMICWSIHADVPHTMSYGCFTSITGDKISSDGGVDIFRHVLQPFLNPGGNVCFNQRILNSFLGLLLCLQVITLMWLAMIIRVAFRVFRGAGADDSRSDDEGDAEEENQTEHVQPVGLPLCEQEMEIDEIRFMRRASPPLRRKKKAGSHATGLSIPGHSDRKELLGRIGCDKPS